MDAVVEAIEAAVVEGRNGEEDAANLRATIVEEEAVIEVAFGDPRWITLGPNYVLQP